MKSKKVGSLLLAFLLLFVPLFTANTAILVSADGEITSPAKSTAGTELPTQFNGSTFVSKKWSTGNGNELFYKNNINADLENLYNKNVYVEFDFYVEDKDLVLSTANMIDFYISTSQYNPWSVNYLKYNLKNHIKQDGWNHIILYYGGQSSSNYLHPTRTDGGNTPIKSYGIVSSPNGGNTSFAGTAIADSYYGFANLKFTQVPETEAILGEKTSSQFTNTNPKGIQWQNYVNGNELFYRNNIGTVSLSETDYNNQNKYIEFDVYVEDIDVLTTALNGNSLDFYISAANGAPWNSNYMKYNIAKQLKKSGWNHIIFRFGGSSQRDAVRPVATPGNPWPICSYGVVVPNNFASTAVANHTVIFTNPVFTTVHETEAAVGVKIANQFSTNKTRMSTWGFTSDNEILYENNIGSVSIGEFYNKNARVEFDLYIADKNNFLAAVGSRAVEFYLSATNGAPWSSNYLKYNIKSQITQDGWNHIVLYYGAVNGSDPTAPIQTLGDNTPIRSYGLVAQAQGASSFRGSVAEQDVYGISNVIFTDYSVGVVSHSLVLADSIGVNFIMNLYTLTAEEKTSSYMTFAISHDDKERQMDFADTFMSGKNYGFTCYLSSVQMAETVTPTLHYTRGGVEQTYTGESFSVKDYIDYVVENSGSFPSKVVTLVKALGDYGHYAQIYLGGRNGWEAGTNYTAIDRYRAADYADYSAYTTALSSDGVTKTIDGTAVTGISYSLNLDSKTYVNIQLTTTDSLIASATVDDMTLFLSASGKLRTQALPILKLGEQIVITGRGTSNTNNFTITLSGLSYIRAILNSGSTTPAAKNAVAALYDYYTAACDYAGV